ncbi:carbohydrate ABC transporter permease [Paenibacillus sp. FA6]|uniref:carbohydrate ABC transporter permease n=1 Tax=Paenibacillus sp. FA6 TaxID=3413029 RepID=UPI003F65EA11
MPALILFLTVGLYSVGFSIFLSFFNWSGVNFAETARFVWFDNFKYFLFNGSPVNTGIFYSGLFNNFKIGLFSIMIIIPVSMLIAYVVTNIKRSAAFRTIYFIPMVASGVGVYYVWRGLFGAAGTINSVLSSMGLDILVIKNGMLGDPRTAIIGVIITVIWGGIPGTMILYYAGLANIDNSFYESAEIDGASKFQMLMKITWPLLKPMTIIVLIQQLNGAFQMFENIWVLTGGGPGGATDVVGTLIYKTAFKDGRYGMASAMGWSVFVITLILSIISMRAFKSDTE